MSNENSSAGLAKVKPDLAQARNDVNSLLHELETMVDQVQHDTLTNFLAESAVLSAMRTTLALQTKAASGVENSWPARESGKGE